MKGSFRKFYRQFLNIFVYFNVFICKSFHVDEKNNICLILINFSVLFYTDHCLT